MDLKNKDVWYIGIALDPADNNKDRIEMIEFYNSVDKTIHIHTSSGSFLAIYDINNKLIKQSFEEFKKELDICFPIPYDKFKQISVINTSIHDSLKKFLKAFSFEEHMI